MYQTYAMMYKGGGSAEERIEIQRQFAELIYERGFEMDDETWYECMNKTYTIRIKKADKHADHHCAKVHRCSIHYLFLFIQKCWILTGCSSTGGPLLGPALYVICLLGCLGCSLSDWLHEGAGEGSGISRPA
jgi:hypothetical protein